MIQFGKNVPPTGDFAFCVESGQGLSQSFGLAGVAGGELFAVLEADYDGIPVCFRMARSMI